MLLRVVLATGEGLLHQRLEGLLSGPDVLIEAVETRGSLWERMTRKSCDLVVASRRVIPQPDPDRMRLLHELPESPMIVVLSQGDSPEDRATFLAAGYDALLDENLPDRQLQAALQGILSRRRERAVRELASRPLLAQPSLADFVSHSPVMRQFMDLASRVINNDSSLLILGETGVGKERLARALHAESPRCKGPFIAVNCGAFPEGLLESELFGHEEGAFTGAVRSHRGCFELAHRGVIFLDEIGEMPNHLQVKLLRVLQDHQVIRLGSEKPFAVDVRVIAATNRDPQAEVQARRLREDLYYRLNVVTLAVPPLRQRREDIPDLVESYLKYLRPRVGRSVTKISGEAMAALQRYAWPGNVRELINVIERAMLLCAQDCITPADLPDPIRSPVPLASAASGPEADAGGADTSDWADKPLHEVCQEAVARAERAYLIYHLRATGGHVGETARRIGIQPRSLYEKMRRYGLQKESFRA